MLRDLASLAVLDIWVGGLCQLVGMPVAWWRLRTTTAWRGRDHGESRLGILARYMRPVTVRAICWSFLVAAALLIAGVLFPQDRGDTVGIVFALLVFGVPVAVTPFAVARLG
jgi:hypothetical protein